MFSWKKAWAPEDLGIHSGNILEFLEEAEKIRYKLWSFAIFRHGQLAVEGASYPFTTEYKHLVYSVSKTFTSTAIGLAVDRGLIDLQTPVIHFFPECEELPMDPIARTITVEHLLMMATGHGQDSVGDMCNSTEAWPKAFFSKEICHKPGTKFVYDSGGTYMLSEIISRVTGRNLFSWMKELVFDPMDITDICWDQHDGVTTGAWGILIAPRDMAKLGQMYLNKGIFNGKRILSEEWVNQASTPHISTDGSNRAGWGRNYGYQIWENNEGSFRADGAFGQYIMVFPKEDMVVVTTAEETDGSRIFPSVERYLLTELSDAPYARDAYVQNLLKEKISRIGAPVLFAPKTSYMEQYIDGCGYEVKGSFGNHQVHFDVNNSQIKMCVDNIQVVESSNVTYYKGETSIGFPLPTSSPLIGEEQRSRIWLYAAHHTWVEDGVLVLEICWIETGHTQKYVFDFSEHGENFTLKIADSGKQVLTVMNVPSDKNIFHEDMRFTGNMI